MYDKNNQLSTDAEYLGVLIVKPLCMHLFLETNRSWGIFSVNIFEDTLARILESGIT